MKMPTGFFSFDMKDTLRLIVWIVIAAFTLGGLYAQRKADVERFEIALLSEGKARDREVNELKQRVVSVEDASRKRLEFESTITVTLEGVRTELRYMNEKIDVLRTDVRERSPVHRD